MYTHSPSDLIKKINSILLYPDTEFEGYVQDFNGSEQTEIVDKLLSYLNANKDMPHLDDNEIFRLASNPLKNQWVSDQVNTMSDADKQIVAYLLKLKVASVLIVYCFETRKSPAKNLWTEKNKKQFSELLVKLFAEIRNYCSQRADFDVQILTSMIIQWKAANEGNVGRILTVYNDQNRLFMNKMTRMIEQAQNPGRSMLSFLAIGVIANWWPEMTFCSALHRDILANREHYIEQHGDKGRASLANIELNCSRADLAHTIAIACFIIAFLSGLQVLLKYTTTGQKALEALKGPAAPQKPVETFPKVAFEALTALGFNLFDILSSIK